MKLRGPVMSFAPSAYATSVDGPAAAFTPSRSDTAEPVTPWPRQLPIGESLSFASGPMTAIFLTAALSIGRIPPSFFSSTIDLRATSRAAARFAGVSVAAFSRAGSE